MGRLNDCNGSVSTCLLREGDLYIVSHTRFPRPFRLDIRHMKFPYLVAAITRQSRPEAVFGLSGLRTTSGARQMTGRSPSAESVPPSLRGLRGRGGERPFSNCESTHSVADLRDRGSEMIREDSRRSSKQIVQANSCRSMNRSIDSLSIRRTPRCAHFCDFTQIERIFPSESNS